MIQGTVIDWFAEGIIIYAGNNKLEFIAQNTIASISTEYHKPKKKHSRLKEFEPNLRDYFLNRKVWITLKNGI